MRFYIGEICCIPANVMFMLDCSCSLCWTLQATHERWAEDAHMLQQQYCWFSVGFSQCNAYVGRFKSTMFLAEHLKKYGSSSANQAHSFSLLEAVMQHI